MAKKRFAKTNMFKAARHSAGYANAKERKEKNRTEQAEREQANVQRRADGEKTPWELAKAQRRAARAA